MILKKLMILVFLVGAFFSINNLQARSLSVNDCGDENNFFSLFATEDQCCIGSGGACPQTNRACCKGFTCREAFPGAGQTCGT
jgi:hypothetical protein